MFELLKPVLEPLLHLTHLGLGVVALFFTGALNFLGLNDRKVVDPGANLRLRRIMAAVGLVAVLALAWWLHGDDSATVGSGRSISGTGWLLLLILLGGLVAIGRAIWKRIDRSRADGLNPWPKMALWIGGIVAGLWRLGVMSDNDEAAIFTLVAGIIASASVVMWCISAVSFSFGFLVAACRIRSAACDTRARIPLGSSPSLRRLRRNRGSFVRRLQRYYGRIRLLQPVHHRFGLSPGAG